LAAFIRCRYFYVTEANAKGLVLIDDGYFPEQGELF
jgi:hypothetical protein